MKPREFELNVIRAVRAIRLLKEEKQINIARALSMTDSNYCKIERGEKAITLEQLRIVSNYLKTSYLQILIIAESKLNNTQNYISLSQILVNYVYKLASKENNEKPNKEELITLIEKINDYYNTI